MEQIGGRQRKFQNLQKALSAFIANEGGGAMLKLLPITLLRYIVYGGSTFLVYQVGLTHREQNAI